MLAACLVVLAAAASAWTKEGARSDLTTSVPLRAPPGTTVRVGWIVSAPDGRGNMRPFGATGMFVRLLSRTGAPPTTGFAPQSAGRYSAEVNVPAGGIGGVRTGLRGTTDIYFPVVNDPFRSRGGLRCDVATVRAMLRAFVDAYNRGDLRRLDRLFSRTGFRWYSAGAPGARFGAAAFDRRGLIPYFLARHRRGDRLALRSLRFNGYERDRDVGHFELTGRRRATGFRGGRWFEIVGKGAIACRRPPVGIAVLSIGAAR